MLSYQGGATLREDQMKVVQAYLEEKQFSDERHFSSALQNYLQEQPSVGRQTLDFSPQDMERSNAALASHLGYERVSLEHSLQKEKAEESAYNLAKKTYDRNLHEILKGEYSEEFLHALFEEQQGQQPKRSMFDFVKEHRVMGLPLFKEGEMERLVRQNH